MQLSQAAVALPLLVCATRSITTWLEKMCDTSAISMQISSSESCLTLVYRKKNADKPLIVLSLPVDTLCRKDVRPFCQVLVYLAVTTPQLSELLNKLSSTMTLCIRDLSLSILDLGVRR